VTRVLDGIIVERGVPGAIRVVIEAHPYLRVDPAATVS